VSRSDDERVADILDAAAELAEVIKVGHDAFRSNILNVRAAERLLEIIGEASGALSDDFKQRHGEVAWRDVAALRILLAHHYHRIDVDQVWQIATDSVPALVEQLDHP
jgi:uncharacterized protein with HEPN domain